MTMKKRTQADTSRLYLGTERKTKPLLLEKSKKETK